MLAFNPFLDAYEYLLKKDGFKNPDVSRLFIYYNGRYESFGPHQISDTGAYIDDTLSALKQWGGCKSNLWPFNPSVLNQRPPDRAFHNGHKYLTIQCFSLACNLDSMRSCLADGYPFVFALVLCPSFHRADRNGGIVGMPGPGEQPNASHGCHAMLAVGYSDQRRMFIVKNSWSADWAGGVIRVIKQIMFVVITVTGVWTMDSHTSQPKIHYPPDENPSNAIDRNTNTKYLNFGTDRTGLNTGFYVMLQKSSTVTAIQFTTANDFPARDPILFTLEGSNASWSELKKGSSWIEICSGGTGLQKNPGRNKPGPVCDIQNREKYQSYRILITDKRDRSANCVQYSECSLLGKTARGATRGASNDTDEDENGQFGWNVDDGIPHATRGLIDDDKDWYIGFADD
ncbi:unnamed protein product [Didymodactylos carnosus]|uniref:Peptidase C1A papain C-terminal domain-containing protein n=1 Tax=Didymodactylos carnosus TaxID=1234261 RepID=A0A814V872_9BILA|nr:unnamed protein product [Didymodactylos carnosus]CAF1183852.1 unnamed protein product [Didymodactylos carnosus]CAF3816874.1 unnamed protein product [Didymodactylos carnosus]CAF3948172.1 unnamed protein product [Didymodactylos carnosus]